MLKFGQQWLWHPVNIKMCSVWVICRRKTLLTFLPQALLESIPQQKSKLCWFVTSCYRKTQADALAVHGLRGAAKFCIQMRSSCTRVFRRIAWNPIANLCMSCPQICIFGAPSFRSQRVKDAVQLRYHFACVISSRAQHSSAVLCIVTREHRKQLLWCRASRGALLRCKSLLKTGTVQLQRALRFTRSIAYAFRMTCLCLRQAWSRAVRAKAAAISSCVAAPVSRKLPALKSTCLTALALNPSARSDMHL